MKKKLIVKKKTETKDKTSNIKFLTASLIGTYQKCKYSFYLDYVAENGFNSYRNNTMLYNETPTGNGSLCHSVIEDFWNNRIPKTLDGLNKRLEELMIENNFCDMEYMKLDYAMLENFFEYVDKFAPKDRIPVRSEASFNTKINDVPVHGTIDQIFYLGNGMYEIEDYKTSRMLPTQKEIDESVQLSLYDLVFRRTPELWHDGIEPTDVLLTMNYLRHRRIETERLQEHRDLFIKFLEITYEQMKNTEKEKFTPQPSILCYYRDKCKQKCEFYNDLMDGDPSEQKFCKTLKQRIEQSELLKAKSKIIEKELADLDPIIKNTLLNLENPTEINGYKYSAKESMYTGVNTKNAITYLKEIGKLDEKSLLKILNKISVNMLKKICTDEEMEVLENKAFYKYNFGTKIIKEKIKEKVDD